MSRQVELGDLVEISPKDKIKVGVIRLIDKTNGDIYIEEQETGQIIRLTKTVSGYHPFFTENLWNINFLPKEEETKELPLKILTGEKDIIINRLLCYSTDFYLLKYNNSVVDLTGKIPSEVQGKIVKVSLNRSILLLLLNDGTIKYSYKDYNDRIPKEIQGKVIDIDTNLAILNDGTIVPLIYNNIPKNIQGKAEKFLGVGFNSNFVLTKTGEVLGWDYQEYSLYPPERENSKVIKSFDVDLNEDGWLVLFDDGFLYGEYKEDKEDSDSENSESENFEIFEYKIPSDIQGKIIDVSVGRDIILFLLADHTVKFLKKNKLTYNNKTTEYWNEIPKKLQGHIVELAPTFDEIIMVLLDDDRVKFFGSGADKYNSNYNFTL